MIKQKEKEEGTQFLIKNRMVKEACFPKANLRLLGFTFFLLEQKEPKIQECRIASGRHSGQRTWVVTLKVAILQTAFKSVINIY
ncbi:hypothetical protein [Mucilaginibacter sp.]|uniref:hypothetical protein n=1 Tax=Mucilaginibacter sp. TaxID=1882438 RepID=UPI003B00E8C6